MESATETETNKSAGSRAIPSQQRPKHGRSRFANGNALLPHNANGSSVWGRIMRDTLSIVHCGGPDVVSEPQKLMARRIAALEAELVYREDEFARIRAEGGQPDIWQVDLYGRLADRQRRLSDPLGWQRTPKPVPTLDEYLRSLHDEEN
jgi:hypothetical protein